MIRKIAVGLVLALLVLVAAMAFAEQWVSYNYAKTAGATEWSLPIGTGWKQLNALNYEAKIVTISGWNSSGVRTMPPSGTGSDSLVTLPAGIPKLLDLNGATRLYIRIGRVAPSATPLDSTALDLSVGR